MDQGLLSPPPVKPLAGDRAEPVGLSSLMNDWKFTTQTLPLPSIAMSKGPFSPPPVNPLTGDRAEPVGLSSVTPGVEWVAPKILGAFPTQTLPLPLIAMQVGVLSPPPVKPL